MACTAAKQSISGSPTPLQAATKIRAVSAVLASSEPGMGEPRNEDADEAVEQARRIWAQDIDPHIARHGFGNAEGDEDHNAKRQRLARCEGAEHGQHPAQADRNDRVPTVKISVVLSVLRKAGSANSLM